MIHALNTARGIFLALIIVNHIFNWSDSPEVATWFQDYGAIGFVAVSGFLVGTKGIGMFPLPRFFMLLASGGILTVIAQESVAVILVNFALIIAGGHLLLSRIAYRSGAIDYDDAARLGVAIALIAPIISLIANQIPGVGQLPFTSGTYPVISWISIYVLGAALGAYYDEQELPLRLMPVLLGGVFIFKIVPVLFGQEYSMAHKPLSQADELLLAWGYQATTLSLLGGFSVAACLIVLLLQLPDKPAPVLGALGTGTLTLYFLHVTSMPFLQKINEPPLLSLTITLLLLWAWNWVWFGVLKNQKGLIDGSLEGFFKKFLGQP